MKQRTFQILFSLLLGFILPGILFGMLPDRTGAENSTAATSTEPSAGTTAEMTVPPSAADRIVLPVLQDGGIVAKMVLEEYLVGVLLGEMPSGFHMEAKKAQAVAARTVTLRLMTRSWKHEEAVVCTDPSCCQSFVSEEEFLNAGGTQEAYSLALQAVRETGGKVICYDGELIDATYFSCSGGRTEDAVAVWGADVAYLQAVDSPGEEGAAHYTDTMTVTPARLEELLDIDLSGPPGGWFTGTVYTDGGGVASVRIGGTLFTGRQLRSLLGLRSTAFTVEATLTQITFYTRGFGHRVGMSQYGAEAMARSGSGYVDILTHYYTGTAVSDYETGEP